MNILLLLIYTINIIFAIFLVFFREKNTNVTWSWLLVFLFLPVIGFILYLLFGYGLSNKQKFSIESDNAHELDQIQKIIDPNSVKFSYPAKNTPSDDLFLYSLNKIPMTHQNKVDLLFDGQEKLSKLKEDFKLAKKSIHIEYYAFVTDSTGLSLLSILEEKARQGIQVKLLYDELGSKGVDKKYFEDLIQAGGKVSTYLTSQKSLFSFKVNYHNHRKIVVIDDDVSYIGGFNIADQYVTVTKKFGYWRDTHMRIQGPSSQILQIRFLMDWNVSVPLEQRIAYSKNILIDSFSHIDGQTSIQMVSSGPINDNEQIKLTFIKYISSAKKRIWIQTPYLIPDNSIIDALEIAYKSGIDVKIMIPDQPDHPFIYRATQFYAQILIKKGIRVYCYTGGFLHSKVMLIDKETSIIGSANQDLRSYKLNFETSAILFDSIINKKVEDAFNKDLLTSSELTLETLENMSNWIKFKQKISRLFSPVM